MAKKIPCIPPIFHNDKYIVDFKEKSEIFNTFFADHCSLLSKSVLPSKLSLLTEKSLANYYFSKKDVYLLSANPQNYQADSNNLFDCVWPFCGVGA